VIFFVQARSPFNADFSFHAEAKTPDEAGAKALGFLKKTQGVNAVIDHVAPALRQNKKKYSFPSSIL